MAPIRQDVVGREAELGTIDDFLTAADGLPAALVLEGEAGIGKTTLIRHVLGIAERHGYRVLSCAPSEAESNLSFAAAADLLRPFSAEALSALPPVQRRALAGSLLLEEEATADQRAIATAFLGALRALAARSPLLVAVDDLQWMDAASATLLTFAVRRLSTESIALLLTQRVGADRPLGLRQDARRVRLGPLSPGALQRILRSRFGTGLPRPVLREVRAAAGGNTFFALELARSLAAERSLTDGDLHAALSQTLEQLVTDRLRKLPTRTLAALSELAAASDPTILRVDREVLEPAISGDIVNVRAGWMEFTHPLLRAAAYAQLSPRGRRLVHAKIADLTPDAVERARHLARATEVPDEQLASRIEEGAWEAKRRGAPADAVELLEHAGRLAVDDEIRRRRAFVAATCKVEAGDVEGARTDLEGMLQRVPPGPLRADVLAALADDIGVEVGRALELCAEGLAQHGVDETTSARLLLALSDTVFLRNDLRASRRHAQAALDLAEAAGDLRLVARAASWLGQLATFAGEDESRLFFERARAVEQKLPNVDPWRSAAHWLGVSLMWADRLEEARPLLEEQLVRAIDSGNEWAQGALYFHLTQLECRAGDLARAAHHVAEGSDLAELLDVAQHRGLLLNAGALVAVHVGDASRARSLATEALSVTSRAGDIFFPIHHRVVLGFLESSVGDHEAVHRWLGELEAQLDQMGVRDPGVFPFHGDEIEALVALGEHEIAEGMIGRLDDRGRKLDRPRALAIAWRGRGMLAGARGDAAGTAQAFERALAEHDRFVVPLERARTLLAQGVALRRVKQKRAAREGLEQALAIFEQSRARLWADRAQEELARIGGRAPATGELTPSEQRIAALVAEGRSNKEVAAALFLTVRTVESALTKIYAKLEVRSRTELANRFRVHPDA